MNSIDYVICNRSEGREREEKKSNRWESYKRERERKGMTTM